MVVYTHAVLRERLLNRAGLSEPVARDPRFTYEALARSEWSPAFELYMRNRLVMGAFRYGLLGQPKPKWNRIKSIKRRLDIYTNTGNTECLVDVANLCLLEFVEGNHPNKHFHAQDVGEAGEHTKVEN